MDADKQTQWTADLRAKIKQAADALEALDDHISDRINSEPYRHTLGLGSASNRLYTAKSLFGEAVEMLGYDPKEPS